MTGTDHMSNKCNWRAHMDDLCDYHRKMRWCIGSNTSDYTTPLRTHFSSLGDAVSRLCYAKNERHIH